MADMHQSMLPTELLVQVYKLLPFTAQKAFASTNHGLRSLFTPELFSGMSFTYQNKDDDLLETVVAKYGSHVRTLKVECNLYEEDGEVEHKDLTEPEKNLLSGKGLNNLESVELHFVPEDNFHSPCWGDGTYDFGCIYNFEFTESPDDVRKGETERSWRKVMYQVWNSLSTNTSVCRLEVLNLPPRAVSVWKTATWSAFLAQLDDLTISPWGGNDDIDNQCNAAYGISDFTNRMPEFFLDHCSRVKRLVLTGSHQLPYGESNGWHCCPIGLSPDHLHQVQHIELRCCFVDGALTRFLEDRSKNIVSLILVDCDMLTQREQTPHTWAEFFKAVRESGPVMDHLLVKNEFIGLTNEDDMPHAFQPDAESDDMKVLRKAIASGERKVFSYAYVDDFYQTRFDSCEDNLQHCQIGRDDHEYHELMSIVRKNAAEGRNERAEPAVQ